MQDIYSQFLNSGTWWWEIVCIASKWECTHVVTLVGFDSVVVSIQAPSDLKASLKRSLR